MKKILTVTGILVLILTLFAVPVQVGATGAVIYVDASNTTGPWDGSSSNPFISIP